MWLDRESAGDCEDGDDENVDDEEDGVVVIVDVAMLAIGRQRCVGILLVRIVEEGMVKVEVLCKLRRMVFKLKL